MNLELYRDFVYDAIIIDWEKISTEMSRLVEQLNLCQDIRLLGPDTDLYADTTGRAWMCEDGRHNMPSGEIYTSPVEDSVEGRIFFDVPFLHQGNVIDGVRLQFEEGLVVDYSAEQGEKTLKSILEVDDGSKRLGEIAIGMNRGIRHHSMNLLFDEKMADTIHCALGKALKECNGMNESAIHVDMVKSMLDGEIIAGDKIIYKKGKFFYD
jgi:aminopeptidase